MTLALIAALIVVFVAHAWLIDRKDRRHAAQVDRLLLWRHDPHAAALPEPTDVPLYLPQEDDEAWNEAHRKAD
jgi:hypothetical protein